MSMAANLLDLVTRIGTEFKDVRTDISGSGTGDVSGLDTTATNLVDAINEVFAGLGAGGATNLDGLSDVVIGGIALATGHVLRYNGTNFVNVLGTTYFEVAGAVAALSSVYQPLDADLTAIAALTSAANKIAYATGAGAWALVDFTATGRGVVAAASSAALTALIDAATATASGIVELATSAEALTGTDTVRAVTPAGLQAKIDALVASAPGTLDTLNELAAALGNDANYAATITTALAGKQPLDTDLTAIAALTSAANKGVYATGSGTWALYDLSSYGRTIGNLANAAAARTEFAVYSTTEIGDPTTNFVTAFEAALV